MAGMAADTWAHVWVLRSSRRSVVAAVQSEYQGAATAGRGRGKEGEEQEQEREKEREMEGTGGLPVTSLSLCAGACTLAGSGGGRRWRRRHTAIAR